MSLAGLCCALAALTLSKRSEPMLSFELTILLHTALRHGSLGRVWTGREPNAVSAELGPSACKW